MEGNGFFPLMQFLFSQLNAQSGSHDAFSAAAQALVQFTDEEGRLQNADSGIFDEFDGGDIR